MEVFVEAVQTKSALHRELVSSRLEQHPPVHSHAAFSAPVLQEHPDAVDQEIILA